MPTTAPLRHTTIARRHVARALACVALALPTVAVAQAGPKVAAVRGVPSSNLFSAERLERAKDPVLAYKPMPEAGPPPVDVVMPAVVVAGVPKGFEVITVTVPADVPADRSVEYVVLPSGVAPIMGRRSGAIAKGDSRTISFTVGIPSDARYGVTGVGSVIFSAIDAPTVEVPLAVQVAPTRRIEITLESTLLPIRAGDRATLRYRLVNLGNAPDTVQVLAAAPQGWHVDAGDGFALLLPGASVDRTVTVTAPREIMGGSLPVRLTAFSYGMAISSAEAMLELVDGAGRSVAARDGATLKLGALGARGPWDGTPVGSTLALNGRLTDKLQVAAQAMRSPAPGSPEQMALARFGVIQLPPSLALWTRSWRAAVGPLGGTLTDLTGTAVGGQGASLQITRERWGAQALATRPLDGPARYGTTSLFGQLSARVGAARVIGSASSLRETLGPIGDARRLDAIGAGVEIGSMLDRRLASEVAYRRYAGGAGVGVNATASLRSANGMLDVRAAHAPGGTQAFARGANELSLAASRQLGNRFGVSGSAWRLGDEAKGARALQSSGYSLSGNTRIGTGTFLTVGGRTFAYSTNSGSGTFGSGDRTLFTNLQSGTGMLVASIDGMYGSRSRTVRMDGAAQITDRMPVSRLGGTLSLTGRAGSVGINGAVSSNGVSVGYPARQVEAGAHVERVPLVTTQPLRLVAGAAASRVTSFVTPGAWLTTMRGSLAAELPLGLTVGFDAEKNPLYFVSTLGAARARQWMYVGRVERSMALPSLSRGGRAEGVVFLDADGNGRRNGTEAGVAGIVVRRGDATVVTDRHGRYRFDGASAQPPVVDARSLPLGMIAAGTAAPAGVRGGDLALTALTALDVYLRVDAEDSVRVSPADVAKAIVVARDSGGRTWVARSVAGGVARFDALPPGRYELQVDFSQATEPLRTKGETVTFTIGKGTATPPLHVIVQPRPLRFQTMRTAPASGGAPRVVGESQNQNPQPHRRER